MDLDMQKEFALLRQQVEGMETTLTEIRDTVRKHAEVQFRQAQHTDEIKALQQNQLSTGHDVDAAHRKVDEVVNKAKGALWILIIMGGAIQALAFTAIGYTFSNMQASKDSLLLLQYRTTVIEQKVKP